jgi:Tfp pilus assembly pilus retraction ATPase PilT
MSSPMSKITLIAVGLLFATTAVASAHSNEARFEEQNDVIEQGRQDGTITWREGLKLRKQQSVIAKRRDQLIADGSLSKKDRRELHALQNVAEDTIVREQNDSWRRLWWLPRVGK